MTRDFSIRAGEPADLAALEALYPAAFPQEDLIPLVRDLAAGGDGVLSLVAIVGGDLVGHAAFTRCGVAGRAERIALLGPLAVAPARQGQGIGGALVREGLGRLREEGVARVMVAGDPRYYARFGFVPDECLAPPYPLPEEWRGAWRSVSLGDVGAPIAGVLDLPAFWMRPALWQP